MWTGGQITPGHFQDFTVDLGALPDGTDKVVFKALQTYSDGTVVRWIEEPQDGQPEPKNPAPVLKLTAATAGDSDAPAPSAAASAKADPTPANTTSTAPRRRAAATPPPAPWASRASWSASSARRPASYSAAAAVAWHRRGRLGVSTPRA
ncbi:Membrane protein OS=Kitasatospora aureofaciens OX=1894 GN=GCM10010502_69840 PE=4 SV=1 [Kitasatospora aureofaciens]